MKNANRARIAMAVSAALGLAAMSSSASAQLDRSQECETLAWETCYYEGGPGGWPAFRCWHDTYDACMEGGPSVAGNKPDKGDRRSEFQLASSPAATVLG
jgi:hypothetical protein